MNRRDNRLDICPSTQQLQSSALFSFIGMLLPLCVDFQTAMLAVDRRFSDQFSLTLLVRFVAPLEPCHKQSIFANKACSQMNLLHKHSLLPRSQYLQSLRGHSQQLTAVTPNNPQNPWINPISSSNPSTNPSSSSIAPQYVYIPTISIPVDTNSNKGRHRLPQARERSRKAARTTIHQGML